jgi:hypothetical protein
VLEVGASHYAAERGGMRLAPFCTDLLGSLFDELNVENGAYLPRAPTTPPTS